MGKFNKMILRLEFISSFFVIKIVDFQFDFNDNNKVIFDTLKFFKYYVIINDKRVL